MSAPMFRFVCPPSALAGLHPGWAKEMLQDGDIALIADDGGGLAAIHEVAHALGLLTVSVVRADDTAELREHTVVAHAGSLPIVWVAAGFGEKTRAWARARGPMTLLVETDGALPEEERRRIERFVALLGRQAE